MTTLLIINLVTLFFAATSGITALIIWLYWLFKNKNKTATEDLKKKIGNYEMLLNNTSDESARVLYQEKIDELKSKLPKVKQK